MFVIAPGGIGKTCLAVRLAKDLSSKKRVCFISLKKQKGCPPDEALNSIVTQLTYFLAAWGDYLFYNKLRLEMEEGQWKILLQQLDREEHVFIFDDLHVLNLLSPASPLTRFFKMFLEKIAHGDSKAVIFTQKMPHPVSESDKLPDKLPYEVRSVPRFRESELEQILNRRKFVGTDLKNWPNGRAVTENMLEKASGFPIILDFIRKEMEFIPRKGENAAKWLSTKVSALMDQHIQSILGILKSDGPVGMMEFIDYLRKHPDGFGDDPNPIAEQTGLDVNAVIANWEALKWRRLIHLKQERDKVWMLDNRLR